MPRRLTAVQIGQMRREAQYDASHMLGGDAQIAASKIIELCSHVDHLQNLLGRWISLMSVYPAVEGEFTFVLDIEGAELVSDTNKVLPEKS